MNKVNVKIIIGSNYGDECKGLATHYFSNKAKQADEKCLNILYNGGCQRGHTVELEDGRRHVFHHFGSGHYDCADTYFDENFIVNPMIFVEELESLSDFGEIKPTCFISPQCRVTTPFDVFINQIVELNRGKNKHGSCGLGIWETKQRYNCEYNMCFGDLANKTDSEMMQYITSIYLNYLPLRMSYYGINEIPKQYKEFINSDVLKEHYINDFRSMQRSVVQADFKELYRVYGTIIFEGAQGLALDENNVSAYPNVTASETTSRKPMKTIKCFDCDVEICYITRSYFTRHGAGFFPTECPKVRINKSIADNTNVFNDFQDSIRYGIFDINEFSERVDRDFSIAKSIRHDVSRSVFISHLNYTGNICGNCKITDLKSRFDKTYLSFSRFAKKTINT